MGIISSHNATDFDVAVIGAGPAGSTAAISLSNKGYKVAIVDKAKFPRDKACGDVIGPKAQYLLDKINVKTRPFVPISDMDILLASGRSIHLPSEPGLEFSGVGGSLRRFTFDHDLLKAALNNGAQLFRGRAEFESTSHSNNPYAIDIVGSTGRIRINANYIIGADGAISMTARSFGLIDESKALYGFATRQYVEAKIDRPIISILGGKGTLFPGYGWAFPSSDGKLNIGVGVGVLSDKSKAHLATKSLPTYLADLVQSGLVATPTSDKHGSSSQVRPLGGWLKMGSIGTVPGRYRVLLVGDAAGLVNPLQGEGIAQAMESAIMAADAIESARSDPASLYEMMLGSTHLKFQRGSTVLHQVAIRYPKVSYVGLELLAMMSNLPNVASAWGIYWNDLSDSSGPIKGSTISRLLQQSLYAIQKGTGWLSTNR